MKDPRKGHPMKVRSLWPFILIIAALVLMITGITLAAVMGSVSGIILAVMVGTLVLSYVIRHEARSRYVYHRRG